MTETCDTPTDTDNNLAGGALTDRQQRFVAEYLIDQNASAAARRCGYSPQSAASQGAALLSIPAVRDRIRMELRALLAEVGVTLIDLVKERAKAAYFRNGRMFGPSGQLRAIQDMPRDLLELFEIHITWRLGTPVLQFKQPSRERALSALEKMLERLDRQDEKALGQRQVKARERGRELGTRPVTSLADHSKPGEGVEKDPGYSEKHVDLLGSGQTDSAGTRASTSSARTGGSTEASGTERDEIPEKPMVLSGSADEIAEKHVVLSGSPPPSVRAEPSRSAREQLNEPENEDEAGAEEPEPLLQTNLRWDRSKPPGYQLDTGTPEERALAEAQAHARWNEAMGLGWQRRAAQPLNPAPPDAK